MGKYISGSVGDPNTNTHFRFPEQIRKLPFKSGIVGTQTRFNTNDYRLPPTDRNGRPIFGRRTR